LREREREKEKERECEREREKKREREKERTPKAKNTRPVNHLVAPPLEPKTPDLSITL